MLDLRQFTSQARNISFSKKIYFFQLNFFKVLLFLDIIYFLWSL